MSQVILKSGYDILAGWASGAITRPIDTMYIGYVNDQQEADLLDPSDDAHAYFTGLASPRGYMRVPILARPTTKSSGAGYAGNQAVFIAITGVAGSGAQGAPFQTEGPSGQQASRVIEAALVVSSPNGNVSNDMFFAYSVISPGIALGAGAQISIPWTLSFTIPDQQ